MLYPRRRCQTAFFLKKNATWQISPGHTYSDLALNLLLLKAGATEHRPTLIRAERHRSLNATFGANRASLRTRTRSAGGSLGLALFAMLRVVDKLFGVEKSLLVGGKDKLLSANDTLQDPI
jgi:hypothetical protein